MYVGRQTAAGNPIPIIQTGPQAGQIDINALIGQMVDRRKMYYYDTLKLAPGTVVQTQPYSLFKTPLGVSDPYNGTSAAAKTETSAMRRRLSRSSARFCQSADRVRLSDSGRRNPPST